MTKREDLDEKMNARTKSSTTNSKEAPIVPAIPNPLAAGGPPPTGSLLQLLVCVGGIYMSFLTWALLQERITTTSYGPDKKIFRSPLVLNTVQSLFASITGYIYFRTTTSTTKNGRRPAIFPTRALTLKLLLVSILQTLASPFGYASLAYIDYITFILAKSCKLLPVMFLHLTIFRRSYPFYKYAVVASVTAGVAVFTLYHPTNPNKKQKGAQHSSAWGLLLLSINLLFDGLTNSIQDHIFSTHHSLVTGPQMMAALNLLSSFLTISYMLFSPYSMELSTASAFIKEHPRVMYDILGFAACGALGQVFIFHTLSRFGSLVLVTVTVTRKMVSMVLSVVWFGHRLSPMQWVGVGLVFGGVGAEAEVKRRQEVAKREMKRRLAMEAGADGKKGK